MKNLHFTMLILIVLLGALVRLIFWDSAPPALNIDEAAIGYNSYAILKTGADEHGVFLPLALESFGDWKLPVYSYLSILPISILGLNEFSVRLVSIISGVLGIVLIYFISQKLFRKKTISLLAALFFALSPWSIYFSRAAYEVNLATTVFLGGFLVYLHSFEAKKKNLLLLISAVLFGITLFTYHSFIIFTPLFLASLIFLERKKINKKNLAFILIPFILFFALSAYVNIQKGGNKISTTSIFNDHNILYQRVENFTKDTIGKNVIFDRIHTRYLGLPYHFLQNYYLSFSPVFLFDRGGEKLVHNIDGFGNLYAIDALFLFFGICSMFYFKEKNIKIILIWLMLAPIPSALTLDAPNSTRLFILMPLFALVASYGAYAILFYLGKNTIGKAVVLLFACLYFLNVLFFFNLYFIHNNYHRAAFWRFGMKEVVFASENYPSKKVIVKGHENFPYIYFLFFNSYDPVKFRNEVIYYPTSPDGFKYVRSFGKYEFLPSLEFSQEKALYIDDQNFKENDNIITLPNGDPIYKFYLKEE